MNDMSNPPQSGTDRPRARHLAPVASDPLKDHAQLVLSAEKQLLGALLFDSSMLSDVGDRLVAADFVDELHGRIFEVVHDLVSEGKIAGPFPVVQRIGIDTMVGPDKLHVYLGRLVAQYESRIRPEECAALIRDFAKSRQLSALCSDLMKRLQAPSYSAAEIAAEALSMFEALSEQHSDKHIGTMSAATFHETPVPAREWHVPGWIPHRTVTNLSADGGTGKSLLALDLAVATATGADWLGLPVRRGAVLYVGAEDDTDEIHRRLSDITQERGIEFAALEDLHLHCLAGEDAVLAHFDRDNLIHKTAVWLSLLRHIKRLKPRLLVIDPLADFFGGDEINRPQARQFIQMLAGAALQFDLTVLLISHPSVAGMKSGAGTSGSTAWSNSVRSRLYFERIKDATNLDLDPDARVLRTKKANYGRTGESIALRWHNGVFKVDGGDNVSEATYAARVRAESAFLALLKTFGEQSRAVSANLGPTYAPAVFAREELGKTFGGDKLQIAMTSLLEAGRIREVETGSPSRRRRRLEVVS